MNFEKAEFESAAGLLNQLPDSTVPEIVFSGRSNVGKSSLINKVLNRKSLARTSAKPGKTGTINFYKTPDCRLVDLPGYGYARVSHSEKLRWAELVEGYFHAQRKIGLVVQIIDMRHQPTEDDLHMIDFLLHSGLPFVVAATKSDKLKKTERETQLQLLNEIFKQQLEFIPFSAVNGEGVEEIRARITAVCSK
ncbi:ribosome biogenesis GTP-binding protein YihA/YsxC [Caproiciproducens galactitolivorans]|uniref:Probable GTP-binding protein EngB n=1 Tax=Caproiciproducens galactitolivorans TaxID=642589 RepID=A0ABT4BTX5_9FIRM|nr:ribosome biogenesis GTP-binding protein YihA/YsxC [Caproiciproducens galactitolivorans]MCY1714339.1 ribosome biogenesis GTP-binding protein YihA/YsxC [Caproiciproducens galactitolivorans]